MANTKRKVASKVPAKKKFDYKLAGENADKLFNLAADSRAKLRRGVAHFVDAGERLIMARELIAFGHFADYLDAEFDMSQRTAERLMNLVALSSKIDKLSILNLSTLYLLTEAWVPADRRDELIVQLEKEGGLTNARIKRGLDALKREIKPPKAAAANVSGSVEHIALPFLVDDVDGPVEQSWTPAGVVEEIAQRVTDVVRGQSLQFQQLFMTVDGGELMKRVRVLLGLETNPDQD